VYAVRLLSVRRIAVAMSSRHCRAFIQYFRLMYRWGTCSESKEQWEEEADEAQGMFVDRISIECNGH
jgi:hypothetical protein